MDGIMEDDQVSKIVSSDHMHNRYLQNVDNIVETMKSSEGFCF